MSQSPLLFSLDFLLDLQLDPKQFLLHLLPDLLPPLDPNQLLMHLILLLLDFLQTLDLLPLLPDLLLNILFLFGEIGLDLCPRLLPPLPLDLLPRQLPGSPSTSSTSMMRTRTQGAQGTSHQRFPWRGFP